MVRVQFGVVHQLGRVIKGDSAVRGTPREIVDPVSLAEKAETWGYDSFWVPDLLTGLDLDPVVVLSGAATRTNRIRLGTGVLLLPARPPVQLAKTALSLNAISNGRLILGTGIGRNAEDLKAAQVGPGHRATLADEALDVLRRLVHETGVSYRGQYFSFEDLTILPRPTQENSLPIWTSASWRGHLVDGPLKRAGRFGDGFVYNAPPRFYKEAKEKISGYAVSFGRDPETIEWACWMYACLDSSKEEAWKTLTFMMGGNLPDRPDGCYAFGTTDDCVEAIQRYIDIGLTHIVISAKCLPEQVPELYEALAQEVIPRLG